MRVRLGGRTGWCVVWRGPYYSFVPSSEGSRWFGAAGVVLVAMAADRTGGKLRRHTGVQGGTRRIIMFSRAPLSRRPYPNFECL